MKDIEERKNKTSLFIEFLYASRWTSSYKYKNISLFYAAVNSQYERFRTFINLGGKDELQRLYNEHEQIWNCIVAKDLEKLDECISHHLYDGFNSSMKVIRDYPDYFTTSE